MEVTIEPLLYYLTACASLASWFAFVRYRETADSEIKKGVVVFANILSQFSAAFDFMRYALAAQMCMEPTDQVVRWHQYFLALSLILETVDVAIMIVVSVFNTSKSPGALEAASQVVIVLVPLLVLMPIHPVEWLLVHLEQPVAALFARFALMWTYIAMRCIMHVALLRVIITADDPSAPSAPTAEQSVENKKDQ